MVQGLRSRVLGLGGWVWSLPGRVGQPKCARATALTCGVVFGVQGSGVVCGANPSEVWDVGVGVQGFVLDFEALEGRTAEVRARSGLHLEFAV